MNQVQSGHSVTFIRLQALWPMFENPLPLTWNTPQQQWLSRVVYMVFYVVGTIEWGCENMTGMGVSHGQHPSTIEFTKTDTYVFTNLAMINRLQPYSRWGPPVISGFTTIVNLSYRPTWPHPVEFSYYAGYVPLHPTKKNYIMG
jgi:hypothetical protein